METIYKEELPGCDLCEKKAKYDSKTTRGPHAYLCEEHYHRIGTEPTTRLEETPDKEADSPEKALSDGIKGEPETVNVPLTTNSVAEVNCPYCDHPRRVEPDANYTVECEACDHEYKVRSMI